jgi:hypothetical protein
MQYPICGRCGGWLAPKPVRSVRPTCGCAYGRPPAIRGPKTDMERALRIALGRRASRATRALQAWMRRHPVPSDPRPLWVRALAAERPQSLPQEYWRDADLPPRAPPETYDRGLNVGRVIP